MSLETARISFHLIHGDPIEFEIEVDRTRKRNMAADIESALALNYIGVVLEGKMTLIPSHNVEKIEIQPVDEGVLMKGVVTDARPVKK